MEKNYIEIDEEDVDTDDDDNYYNDDDDDNDNNDDDDNDDDDDGEPGPAHWVWQKSKLQQCKRQKICTCEQWHWLWTVNKLIMMRMIMMNIIMATNKVFPKKHH